MRNTLSLFDSISEWSGKTISFLSPVMIVVIVYGVVMRYVFHTSSLWAFEVTVFSCGIITITVGAYTHYLKGHIRMDMFYSRFSPRGRAILDVVTFPLFLLFCGSLLWFGYSYALSSVQMAERAATAWNPPIYPIKAFIPLGALLIMLQGLTQFVRDLVLAVTGRELT